MKFYRVIKLAAKLAGIHVICIYWLFAGIFAAAADDVKIKNYNLKPDTIVKASILNKSAGEYNKKNTSYTFEERIRIENCTYPLFDKKRTGKKNYIQNRFRMKMKEELNAESKLTLVLQDYKFFKREPAGDASISKNDFIFYNAFLEINNFSGIKGLFARIGRQEFTMGNMRLFGNSNWSEGRVWDGAHFIYKTANGNFNLFNLELKRHELTPPIQIRGIYYIDEKIKNLELYTVKYVDRNKISGEIMTTVRKNIDINTFGLSYTHKIKNNIKTNFETAFQTGNWGPDNHRASAYHIDVKYSPFSKLNYVMTLEYNRASGDENPHDGKHGTFNNLFPTNHGKYGYMDLACWQNIKEIAIKNEFDIHKNLRTKLNYHIFKLENSNDSWYRSNKSVFDSRRDLTGISGNDIGREIDVVFTKKIKKNLEAEFGASKFIAGNFVKNTNRLKSETVNPAWSYFQLLKKW